jgi:hypothetical protein
MRQNMKPLLYFFVPVFFSIFLSCQKQEYLKSESEIKKDLNGTWKLIPIPRYDSIINPDLTRSRIEHVETWNFNDTKVTIVNNGLTSSSSYSVNTSLSKAEFKLDNVTPPFVPPARVRQINGTWRIIKVDGDLLIIANDQDGSTGLTELEFSR